MYRKANSQQHANPESSGASGADCCTADKQKESNERKGYNTDCKKHSEEDRNCLSGTRIEHRSSSRTAIHDPHYRCEWSNDDERRCHEQTTNPLERSSHQVNVASHLFLSVHKPSLDGFN